MKSTRLYTVLGSVFAFVILLSGCESSVSDTTPDENRFGAIAFSTTTQRWHIRWNVSSQDRADALAKQYCGTGDCTIVLRFGLGQCGTFSLGDGGALGIGVGTNETDTALAALANCTKSGQACKVAPVRCNQS